MKADRKRHPESTKNAILDAAEQLFLSQGFAETSTSEVASLAGVNKSLIHHHFGNKEGLWDETKRRIFATYHDHQKDLLDHSEGDAELLRVSMISYFQFLAERPEFGRMMCMMYLQGDSSCEDLADELIQAGVEKIRRAQKDGFLREDLNPIFILISFLSLVEHWFLSKQHFFSNHFPNLSAAETETLDQDYLRDLTKIFFEGILAS